MVTSELKTENLSIKDIVFVLDLNWVNPDDSLSASLYFTYNVGLGLLALITDVPAVGDIVRGIDDENDIFTATIVKVDSYDRIAIQIDWDSQTPTTIKSESITMETFYDRMHAEHKHLSN